ncbi:MAG: hypothetical protein ACI4QY_02795 [Oscillospiraceae bacterium]
MRKISALILAAAMLLTLTACDGNTTSSDVGSQSDVGGQSDMSGQSTSGTSGTSGDSADGLSALPEWDYVSLVRDNYEKYFIASSSPENGLPNVSNNLIIPSLKTAVEEDGTGRMKSLLERFTSETSFSERIKLTDEILNLLCKTDAITEQNSVFSPKKLAILEGFWGTGDEFPAPTAQLTAEPLEEAYKFLTERYCMAMIGSEVLPYVDLIGSKRDDSGKYYPDMESYNKQVFEDWKSGKLTEKQLFDNALYLAYYGVMRDKDLIMLEEFREYAAANAPEALTVINTAANEASDLFSGINDVVIAKVTVNMPESDNSGASDTSGENAQS